MNYSQVSIVIPAYNDPDGLSDTLGNLQTQTCDDFEIITAVTPTNGETLEVAQSFAKAYSDTVSVVTETKPGPAAGRNAAIRESGGEIIGFLDSDMIVEKEYVESAVRQIEINSLNYAGCDVQLTISDGNETTAARFDQHTGFPMQGYIKQHQYAPTCALFVRREVFCDIGLFDERLTAAEDLEFGNRVADAGYELAFLQTVTAYHPARDSLRELIKKDRRVGRGLCQLQRCHPGRYGTPGIPPRPSGIKRPERELPVKNRLTFGAVSKLLTAVRGVGYYEEYVSNERPNDFTDFPQLES